MHILLSKITNWQSYFQLLDAIDPPLLATVRPSINKSMEWKELIQQCGLHDSVQDIEIQHYK